MTPVSKKPTAHPSKARPRASRSKRVVVVFNDVKDPTVEQRQVLQKTIDDLKKVRVLKEIPGTVSLEVEVEDEGPLRSAIQSLDDWDVSDEGAARMPDLPLKEDE
ncbi:MAG: hypothetical protein A3J29_18845 [Acidobacteria bacterium RIFCSPLOWO2_12_FULL_67_14b]|nr:MAG: hypothetical protein A3J29_18845 [Acidobacteria bacterium RIFCSPLOWO2_12_FULL_67_14b]